MTSGDDNPDQGGALSCGICGSPVGPGNEGVCPKCALQAAIFGGGDDTSLLDTEASTLPGSSNPVDGHGAEPGGSERWIGPYRLLEPIGEGGMGQVFLAEQNEPVRRQVAIKVVRPGMGSEEIITRFEAERQALAVMDHPHIARVFDAGTEEGSGLPYFVMEFVQGISITRFCDERRLEIPERLQIFIQVCRALQHAHQKGVIHRDLKPSNILVEERDGKPFAKVIDFGIAKAVGGELTEKTLFTQAGQLFGTPQYMSPEQADLGATDIDTRSDIYSMGIILYELLTGEPPIKARAFREAGLEELLRMIREEEAPRPSRFLGSMPRENLTTVIQTRGTTASRLTSATEGDLDWITLKALEKDRDRRYETANALAMDIERYLENQPILARPPTLAYRLTKYAKRNRALLTTVALVFSVLIAGMIATAWKAREARIEKERAVAARDDAEELISYMLGDLQGKLESFGKIELLAEVGDRVESYFEHQEGRDASSKEDRLKAKLFFRLATIKRRQGRGYDALELAEEALGTYRRLLKSGESDLEVLTEMAETVLHVLENTWDERNLKDRIGLINEVLPKLTSALKDTNESSPSTIRGRIAQSQMLLKGGQILKLTESETSQDPSTLAQSAWDLSREIVERNPASMRAELNEVKCRLIAEDLGVEGAESGLEDCLRLVDERPDDFRLKQDLLILLQSNLSIGKRTEPALELADELIAHDPRNPAWQLLRASVYSACSNLKFDEGLVSESQRLNKEAESQINSLIALDPENPDYLFELSDVYSQKFLYPAKKSEKIKIESSHKEIWAKIKSLYPHWRYSRSEMVHLLRCSAVYSEIYDRPKLEYIRESWEMWKESNTSRPNSDFIKSWRFYIEAALAQEYANEGMWELSRKHFGELRAWLESENRVEGLRPLAEREIETFLMKSEADPKDLERAKEVVLENLSLTGKSHSVLAARHGITAEESAASAANALQLMSRHVEELAPFDREFVMTKLQELEELMEKLDPKKSYFCLTVHRLSMAYSFVGDAHFLNGDPMVSSDMKVHGVELALKWLESFDPIAERNSVIVQIQEDLMDLARIGRWQSPKDREFLNRVLLILRANEQMVEESPQFRRLLGVAMGQLGVAHLISGEKEQSIAYLQSSEAILQEMPSEGLSVFVQMELARTKQALRKALSDNGQLAASELTLMSLVDLREEILGEYPDHTENRSLLAEALRLKGTSLQEKGELDSALAAFSRGIEVVEPIVEDGSAPLLLRFASLLKLSGMARIRLGDVNEAQSDLRSAIEVFDQLERLQPLSASIEVERARAKVSLVQQLKAEDPQAAEIYRLYSEVVHSLEALEASGALPAHAVGLLDSARRAVEGAATN